MGERKTYIKQLNNFIDKPFVKILISIRRSGKSEEREFSTLLSIHDQYPKFVVTMDELWQESVEGVQHIHVSDFLSSSLFNKN